MHATAPAALGIAGLHVRYGRREVLRGLDLAVGRGEIFGLLGPNGAGKTTLIRTICGRITPAAGTVAILGRPVSRTSLKNLGLVPQDIALYPHLTVRENLDVFGRLSGLTRADTLAAIAWASAAADLVSRLDQRLDILSGGWKRRVNIAAAILHRPALLILDEPTVGVDIDARNGLHEVIQQLSQAGMGVLLATHDLDQAETLCSRVGFLRDGVLAPQGHPRQLIDAVFADQREIILELRQQPTQDQILALHRMGFAGSNAHFTWSKLGSPDEGSAPGLAEALEQVGLSIKEMRFRSPGLDSLFVRLGRRDAAA